MYIMNQKGTRSPQSFKTEQNIPLISVAYSYHSPKIIYLSVCLSVPNQLQLLQYSSDLAEIHREKSHKSEGGFSLKNSRLLKILKNGFKNCNYMIPLC